MSVVIIGGNECMVRDYKVLCEEYQCKVKIYPKTTGAIKGMGNPDLLVLFTGTVSHKMVRNALKEIRGQNTRVVRSHTSSMSALKNILEENV
ncbi:MAG: DUF2325 domain-containing protein [Lachnospiraceae bacterium]